MAALDPLIAHSILHAFGVCEAGSVAPLVETDRSNEPRGFKLMRIGLKSLMGELGVKENLKVGVNVFAGLFHILRAHDNQSWLDAKAVIRDAVSRMSEPAQAELLKRMVRGWQAWGEGLRPHERVGMQDCWGAMSQGARDPLNALARAIPRGKGIDWLPQELQAMGQAAIDRAALGAGKKKAPLSRSSRI